MVALKADFAPNSGYTVVEWMAKHIEEDTARIVEAFELTVRNKHSDHWTYIAHKDAVRVILRAGMASPDVDVLERSKALISYLASIGEKRVPRATESSAECTALIFRRQCYSWPRCFPRRRGRDRAKETGVGVFRLRTYLLRQPVIRYIPRTRKRWTRPKSPRSPKSTHR